MRRLLIVSLLALLAPLAGAEVIRCADPAGQVSYTDGACPTGAKKVGQVAILEAATPTPEELEQRRHDQQRLQDQQAVADKASHARHDPADAYAHAAAPAGPAVIDPSANVGGDAGDPLVADDGYGHGYAYPGGYAQPPRNLAPRIRNCDAKGCQDTMGNHYSHAGTLTSYRGLNGQTCRPVGTTVICR